MRKRADGQSEIERLWLRVSELEQENLALCDAARSAAETQAASSAVGCSGPQGDGMDVCEQVQAFAKSLPLAVAYGDRDRRCRFYNEPFAALYQLNGEPPVECPMADIVGPDAYSEIESGIRSALAGEAVEFQHELPTNGGREKIKAHYIPHGSAGGSAHGFFIVLPDHTETRRTRDALHASQARLQAFLDNMPCEMGIKDLEGRYVLINRFAEKLYGRTSDEIRGLTPHDLFPADVADQLAAQDGNVLDTGEVLTEEVEAKIDGAAQTFLATEFPILNDAGEISALGSVATDVSHQKRQEEALRKTEAMYKKSERLAGLGHWEWDEVDDRCVYCSEELARLHGYGVDACLRNLAHTPENIEAVHPRDREKYRQAVTKLREQKVGFKIDYRLLRPDGTCIDVRRVAEPVLDDRGVLVRSVGYVQDVTGQMRTERALRESERRFRDFADASSHWLWETDSDSRFTYVSDDISKIGGEDPSELVGKKMWDTFRSRSSDSADRPAPPIEIEQCERFEEFDVGWKDGTGDIGVLSLSATPVFDDEGEFVGYRGTARDITEQRRAVEELQQSETLLRQAAQMADLGHWVWDEIEDKCAYCSEELAHLDGMAVEECLDRFRTIGDVFSVLHPDDRDQYERVVSEARTSRQPYEVEYRYRANSAEYRHVRERGEPVFDADGTLIRTIGIVQDISKSKRTEETLRKSQADLAEAQRMAKIGHWYWSIETDELVSCSEEYARIHGVSPDRIKSHLAKQMEEIVHPEDRDRVRKAFKEADDEGRDYEIGYRIIRPDGEVRHVHEIGEAVRDENGRPIAHAGTIQDVTEQKLIEEALRRSEEKFRALIEGSIQGIVVHQDWKPVFANQASVDIFGYDRIDELTAIEDIERHIAPHERKRLAGYRKARLLNREAPTRYTAEYLRKDGSSVWLESVATVVEWDGGTAIQSTFLDVTERRKAEESLQEAKRELERRVEERTRELSAANAALQVEIEEHRSTEHALRESEKRIRAITDAFPSQIAYVDRDRKYRFNNAAYKEWFGVSGEECLGRHVSEVVGKDNYKKIRPHIDRALSGEKVHYEYLTAQGRYAEVNYMPDFDDGGNVRGFYGLVHDISEAKAAEMALTESRELLRAILDVVPVAISVKDSQFRYVFMNRYVATSWAIDSDDAVGCTLDELVAEELASSVSERDRAVRESGHPSPQYERNVTDAGGRERSWLTTKIPIKSEDGALRHIVTVSLDITDLKAREEELRHVQKMEAVGKLTGGIAHDFNNLLFVICGNLALLEKEIEGNERAGEISETIGAATALGADLTRSLLTFSRQQPLKPTLVDLRDTIQGTIATLLRTLGEAVHIELSCGDLLWPVLVDRGMLENCLLNLALNARDAMPDGGTLSVSVANVDRRTGSNGAESLPRDTDYVEIRVSDTGTGMTKEIVEQCFEPFFSTKPPGSGTGLGLSMVYGIVTQSGGDVAIDSEVGKGTAIQLFLPRAKDAPSEQAAPGRAAAPVARGVETILVAEDDDAVRRVAVNLLRDLGYRTREAADAEEALTVLEDEPGIDLLFTDIVLPGKLNGPQLASQARERRPRVKVLFTTGHSTPAAMRDLEAWSDTKLLMKPYGPEELAKEVRVELDSAT
ncbi:MAG: PAS domain S-box protein [Alphaproteobacteria bacterium]|nr:PAS domain S-box protein [Alphaproteobacteria bacterium]